LKAEREGRFEAQGTQGEELLKVESEVKERLESVESRLAASEEKQDMVLSILLRMESQNKEKEKENEKEKEGIDT
jgi:hypothetical protein